MCFIIFANSLQEREIERLDMQDFSYIRRCFVFFHQSIKRPDFPALLHFTESRPNDERLGLGCFLLPRLLLDLYYCSKVCIVARFESKSSSSSGSPCLCGGVLSSVLSLSLSLPTVSIPLLSSFSLFLHDQTIPKFRALRPVEPRIIFSSETWIGGIWGHEFGKCVRSGMKIFEYRKRQLNAAEIIPFAKL